MTITTIFQVYISARFAINLSKFVYKKLNTKKTEKDGDINVTVR